MSGVGTESEDIVFGTQTLVSDVVLGDAEVGEDCAVLFAAVCGHARLVEKLGGDEAMRAAERCLKRMERAVQACAGQVVKQLNGELMALFATADAAAQAAVDMQLRIADLPPVSGIKLGVRAAFSFGPVFTEGDGVCGAVVSRAAALAGMATGGQVLTGACGADALSAAWRKPLVPLAESCGEERVFQFRPEGPAASAVAEREPGPQAAASTAAGKQLTLRYAGAAKVFAEDVVCVTLGRDAACDVVVHDRRASRQHARIERRGMQIVLVDQSTNGTFLSINGGTESFLRHAEGLLYGKGRLTFAGSARTPSAEVIEFELL